MSTPLPADDQNVSENDEDYTYIAPQSVRPFNAGLKRKRVEFIPASDQSTSSLPPTTLSTTTNTSSTAGARYLSIVLGQSSTHQSPTSSNPSKSTPPSDLQICPTCSYPIHASTPHQTTTTNPATRSSTNASKGTHETSIPHLLSQPHSHPPSSLDRTRLGLKYLSNYGWDPDSRVGLGARQEGIRNPIKPIEKRDRSGVGLFSRDGEEDEYDEVQIKKMKKRREREAKEEEERRMRGTLDAKMVRKLEEMKRVKAERLRSVFYGEDHSRYLGREE